MKKFLFLAFVAVGIMAVRCANNTDSNDITITPPTPAINFTVVGTFPHDTTFFTEGFEFHKGSLLESTGLEGKSKLVQYNLESGKVEKQINLDPKSFGEGITVFRDTLYQLTYQDNKVNVYDTKDFKKIKELPFSG